MFCKTKSRNEGRLPTLREFSRTRLCVLLMRVSIDESSERSSAELASQKARVLFSSAFCFVFCFFVFVFDK